ncbi:hypothetical protein BASA83_010466 [Batrachochytrium salamandrivorans]|nr:hypothetical protein BASA83_010466 [Batrachochytrium salamandrivorans]
MSPRKAPGDDGISTALYQAALYTPANTQEGVPPTSFARALLRVLQMRIERFVEANNLLSYKQAEFRKREECVGQVVSLVDIIQRRQNAGLNTHVLFIDIRKAFDTVPLVHCYGSCRTWDSLVVLLLSQGIVHILICSSTGRLTTIGPIPSTEGVRQGCPLSGLLFNLFINDILDGVAPITVPGLSRNTNPIRGLMYADDVAVFADSEQSLLAASTAVEQWANQWEMQFGVAKCGIISFTGHLAPRLDSPLDIQLHGQLLTVNYRSRIFSAVVMGKAYYGLELVGGNKSHLAPLQTTINKGIRLFTGARLSTAIGPLLVETGIGSLLTRSLVSRTLVGAVRDQETPINAICSLFSTFIAHLVVECEQVTGHRIQSGLVPAIQKSRLRLLGCALDPGVENVYTWLRGGVLNGKADLDQRWLDGTVEHESMGTRHDNRAGSNG